MKALRFHEAARREANLAAFRFTEISIQLAQRFLDALQVAYASAAGSPRLYPTYLHDTRRVLLKRFPYFIVYLDWENEVYIVAIAHAKRRPGYWGKRL
jgi:toxin ParE1/3/4